MKFLLSIQQHLPALGSRLQYQGMALKAMTTRKLDIHSKYQMKSGYGIPVLGYGVYQTPAADAEAVVLHAFKTGYRHVDSARVYRNEQPCADAIRSYSRSVPRSEIFFTSKVPPKRMSFEAATKSVKATSAQTSLPYIDLYLLHAPYGGRESRLGAWDALVSAQKAGLIRSLGVSNYGLHHLRELEEHIESIEATHGAGAGGDISVGQWELHPWLPRHDIVSWCRDRNVVVEAYCPLVRGQRSEDSILQSIAHRHGKTWAQVLLRWSLQKGFVPLPKSVNERRIEENSHIYDFELSEQDMADLERKDSYEPCSWDPTVSND